MPSNKNAASSYASLGFAVSRAAPVIRPYGRHSWSFAFGVIRADRPSFIVTHHNDLVTTNDSVAY